MLRLWQERSDSQIIGQIRENMGRFNDEISEIMSVIKNNWAFRSYLTSEDRSSATASYTQYSMVWNLEHALPPDYFEKMSIVLVGVNGSSYLSSDAGLTVSVEELLDSAVTQETRRQPNRILYQYVDDGFTTLTQGDSAIVASTGLNYAGGQSNHGYAYVVIPQEVLRDFYSSFSSDANSLMLLDSEGVVIPKPTLYDVFVTYMGAHQVEAFSLVQKLRDAGFKADMDHTGRSLKAQFKYANKMGATLTATLGDEEIASGVVKVKNMATKEEQTIALDNIADGIRNMLASSN